MSVRGLASNPKSGIDPDLYASLIDKLQANFNPIGYPYRTF